MITKTRLLNQSAVREKTLAVLASRRPHLAAKFTRVSGEFFIGMEAALTNAIEDHIINMPTSGKTIR